MPAPPRKLSAAPSRHIYDVIIVGGQLGGAVAGALLSKRGHRVLLIEHDGVGPGYEHDGWVLPYFPSVIPQLKTMPAAEEVFTELGLTTLIQRGIRVHQPDLQLILPRHRLDLHHEEARRLADLKREFGNTGEAVAKAITAAAGAHETTDAFFKAAEDLPPLGLFESMALKKRIRSVPGLEAPSPLGEDDPASFLLRQFARFVTYAEAPEGAALVRPLSQVLKGTGRYPGGVEGLRDALFKRIGELGGDVIAYAGTGSVVEHLSFEGNELVGIKVVQSETLYRASCVVGALDAAALRRLLPEKKRQRALVEQLDLSNVHRFLFTVNWVIPEERLPRGFGELLLLDAGSELGALLVQLGPARKAAAKADEESLRTVTAGAYVPANARDLGDAHLEGIAHRMGDVLADLMPFSKEKAVLISSPQLHSVGVRGSRLLPHPLYSFEGERILGVSGLVPKTPLKNLYLAGREVLPGLGVEGEFLAGQRAAGLVQEQLGRKNPLKR